MTKLSNSILWVAGCALLVVACGPVPEGKELEGTEPGTTEVDAPEVDEPGDVSQQTFVGDLGSALGSGVAVYNTCTASNQWRTTCGSGSSRDISYVWRVPTTGAYAFSTRNSSFDTVLEIRNYKATSEVLACNDDTSTTYQSAVSLTGLIRGTQLLITIEGYEGGCGTAHLNIAQR